MTEMPVVSLAQEAEGLAKSGQRVKVLWQEPDALTFVARGREYRSEYHINPSDEIMYMIKGTMHLHYRKPDGKEDIAVIPEGSAIFTPSGIPHSPRFPPEAFALISERARREGEVDRFQWYCPKCDAFLHEEKATVADYQSDPVSAAYARFFGNEEFRTCKSCGEVMPAPESMTAAKK